jgi:hypothetical protein
MFQTFVVYVYNALLQLTNAACWMDFLVEGLDLFRAWQIGIVSIVGVSFCRVDI